MLVRCWSRQADVRHCHCNMLTTVIKGICTEEYGWAHHPSLFNIHLVVGIILTVGAQVITG